MTRIAAVFSQFTALKERQALGMLLGSEMITKAIQFLGSIILARLYAPEEFGLFGIYFALATIGATIGNMALHRALPLPRADLRAAALVVLGSLSTLCTAATITVILLVGLIWPVFIPNRWMLLFLLATLPLGVIGWAATPMMQMSLTRTGWFGMLAVIKIGQVSKLILLQTGFGIAKLGGFGLAFGDSLGRLATLLAMLTISGRSILGLVRRLRPAYLWKTLRHYRRFPLVVGPTLIIQTIPFTVMPLAIGPALGAEDVGFWIQSMQVYNAFFAVSVAISPYFYRSWIIEKRDTGGVRSRSLLRATAVLAVLGGAPALLLTIAGPQLFTLAFGVRWGPSGEIAAILAPALFLQTLGGALLLILTVMRRESWTIAMAVVWAAASIGLGASISALELDIFGVCRYYASLTGTVYAGYFALAWLAIRN